MQWLYRTKQFLRSMTARVEPGDREQVEALLPALLSALFYRMDIRDQAHSLRVLRDLQGRGVQDLDLLRAALLHDVGKSRCPVSPFERVLVVVANRALPRLVIRLGQRPARGPLRAFAAAAGHPTWGAALVEAAGGSERLAALVRFHQEPPGSIEPETIRPLLRELQQADNRN